MLKKFPFADTLLQDLAIVNPETTVEFKVRTVLALAKRFSQLKSDNSGDLDKQKEKFQDFLLSPDDLPAVTHYQSEEGGKHPRCGPFWFSAHQMKTKYGGQRYSTLSKLMFGLLCMPSSNADSELGFRCFRKITRTAILALPSPR